MTLSVYLCYIFSMGKESTFSIGDNILILIDLFSIGKQVIVTGMYCYLACLYSSWKTMICSAWKGNNFFNSPKAVRQVPLWTSLSGSFVFDMIIILLNCFSSDYEWDYLMCFSSYVHFRARDTCYQSINWLIWS